MATFFYDGTRDAFQAGIRRVFFGADTSAARMRAWCSCASEVTTRQLFDVPKKHVCARCLCISRVRRRTSPFPVLGSASGCLRARSLVGWRTPRTLTARGSEPQPGSFLSLQKLTGGSVGLAVRARSLPHGSDLQSRAPKAHGSIPVVAATTAAFARTSCARSGCVSGCLRRANQAPAEHQSPTPTVVPLRDCQCCCENTPLSRFLL